jgi:hypothetical protein
LTALTLVSSASAGWVREFFGHYHDVYAAREIAARINQGHAADWRNATYEQVPHPVTRTFGVYADRWYPDQAPAFTPAPQPAPANAPVLWQANGQITRGDALDRLRQGRHHKVYQVRLAAGRAFTIDLSSGNGSSAGNPSFFDTWLRIEDANGNVLAQDDDSGPGLNARVVFTPRHEGVYRLVVTTYSAGATGSFNLAIR